MDGVRTFEAQRGHNVQLIPAGNLGHPWWNVWNILSFWRCCKKWCPRRKWGYFKASLDFVVSDSIGNCQSDNFLLDFLMYQLHLHKEPTGNKDLIPVLLIEATCACCLYRIYISSMPKVINKNNIWLACFLDAFIDCIFGYLPMELFWTVDSD